MDRLVGTAIGAADAVDLCPIADCVVDGDRLVNERYASVLRDRSGVVGDIIFEPIVGFVVGNGERKLSELVAAEHDPIIPTETAARLCDSQALSACGCPGRRLLDRRWFAGKTW